MNFLLVLLLVIVSPSLGDSVTDGTKLISTFLVHRHGDRTPLVPSLPYVTDREAVVTASAKYGYGQLTDLGKQRAYALGQSIRERYDELLSPQYNRSEIYIRSTDSTRTKMTILTAMAAVYPAYPGSWSEGINWVPVPYTTVPAKYDFNQATISCPKLSSAVNNLTYSYTSRLNKYDTILNLVSEQLGLNITANPALIFSIFDALVSQRNLGVPLSEKIAAIMPKISAAADEAADIIFGDDKLISLQAGPLLNEFFIYSQKQINGEDTPRVRIYSAHDLNVYVMMAVAKVTPRQGVPPYAAAFALELRRVEKTGQYVVLPVYFRSPGEDIKYLHIAGCGDSVLCDYNTYKDLVSKYTLDESTWRTECGFSEDLFITDLIFDR